MLRRGFAIFQNVTIFRSNYNLVLRSYGQLFVLVLLYVRYSENCAALKSGMSKLGFKALVDEK